MNKNLKKIIACTLIGLSLFNVPLQTRASDIMFSNKTVKDGLSQGTILSMFQDGNGYIWIGTTDGLNRYNGYEYKKYYKNTSKENSIVNGAVTSINEDKNKNLWVGTSDGISRINLEDYSIKNYDEENSNLISDDISCINVDDKGRVIIASKGGLSIYNESLDNFTVIDFSEGKNFQSTKLDDEGNIYGLSDDLLFKFNLESKTYEEIYNEKLEETVYNNGIIDIFVDENIIWIGTNSKGLFKYNMDTCEIEDVKKYYKDEDLDISYKIKEIYKEKNGNILVGTDNGLVVLDTSGGESTYTYNLYDKYTIVNNNIISIMQDSSGLIWIGTYSGLSIYKPDDGISHYGNNPSRNGKGLLGNIVHGLYEDEKGKLWVGSPGYGITIIDRKNNTFEYITNEGDNSLNATSLSDITGNDKKIFISTNEGINIIDKETREVEYITEGLSSQLCNRVYVEGDNLWVGTVKGLDCINLKDYSIKNYNYIYEEAGINDYITSVIFKDSLGNMWFGLSIDGGVVKFNSETNEVKSYRNMSEENSISDNSIAAINEDHEGNLWFGTSAGLNRLDKETETFKVFSVEDGLNNNTIYNIGFNEKDEIWISTNSGVELLKIDNEDNIFVQEYIKNTEFNNHAYIKTSEGEMVFGSIDGLYIIDPKKVMDNGYIPELKFDTLKVNGVEVKDFVNVPMVENYTSMSVKLFTTFYDNSKNTKFYYKLDKSDKWMPIEGNEIVFSNLFSGKHHISFIALNSNGMYSEVQSIYFKVKPPFWKSNVAKVAYIILIILIIVYIYHEIREKNVTIKVKNNQLVNEMKEKNHLLEKVLNLERRKNNYLVNMSHELRTPLNIIYSIQQLVLDVNEKETLTKKDLKRYMEMSGKNIQRLLKLINDLIDSSKIDAGSYKLFIEEKDIIYTVEEAALSLKSLVEQKGVNLIFDTEIEELVMQFDENAIERCIINIVNNAAKFTSEGGEIFVNLTDDNENIRIDIRDTGCGIPKEKLNNIFDRFNQVVNSKREASYGGSGLGLTITKRLIELHNGEIFVKSEVGKGSTFTLILPKVVTE